MLFNTLDYAKFFAAVFVVSWLLVRTRKVRVLFLLAASYVFYAHWDWRFLPLIWGSSTVDWLLGHAIGRSEDPKVRKLWLVATVVVNLGVLAIFKYFNFGLEMAKAAATALGFAPPEIAFHIALPVGISFFTFESMSYVIDIYRRELQPHKSYLEYLTFVAFFPHLVAGPIVRPRDLLPQLTEPARFSPEAGSEGLFLIAKGLFKKVAIGDFLAVNLIDRVFDAPLQFSGLECYAAIVAYAVQIYCDFSGYTDIASGSALLLGVRFPLNFDSPYKAHNIVDFWRRWHISLSTWLRDYLYIPLGGNRKGHFRTYVNLMLTMLLGGLWHGASLSFVAWGGLHGAALAATRAYETFRARRGTGGIPRAPNRLARTLGVIVTFHLVCLGWVFFRANSFSQAGLMLSRVASFTFYHPNLHTTVLFVLALGLLSHYVPEAWFNKIQATFIRLPALGQAVCLILAALAIKQLATTESVPFVYFQF
ncbi:MAG: MBOAT family protein [Polyangiaceae bacterium]|nr:MBOAT family protein [Polyangiaceae bacterium]